MQESVVPNDRGNLTNCHTLFETKAHTSSVGRTCGVCGFVQSGGLASHNWAEHHLVIIRVAHSKLVIRSDTQVLHDSANLRVDLQCDNLSVTRRTQLKHSWFLVNSLFFLTLTNDPTSTLSQRKGRAPQLSITFSCQARGGGSALCGGSAPSTSLVSFLQRALVKHSPLNSAVSTYLSVHISIGQIPDDEDVGDRDEIFGVGGDSHAKRCERVSFEGVL